MSIYNGHNEDSSGNILLSIGNGMTATLESGTTASQAYTKGSYVFFDNKLCKVTQDITSGTTLEIGTNLAQTSIGTELTSHLRSNDGKEFYFDVKDGSYGFYPSASKVAEEFVPFGGTLSSLWMRYYLTSNTAIFLEESHVQDWAYIDITSGYGTVKITSGGESSPTTWTGTSGRIYTSQSKIPTGETGVYLVYGDVPGFSGKYARITSTGTSYGTFEFVPG